MAGVVHCGLLALVAAGATAQGKPMRRLLAALLGMVAGYPVFALLGYWAIGMLSGNQFDADVESTMTAAFVIGPAGAVIGLVAGLILGGPRRPRSMV